MLHNTPPKTQHIHTLRKIIVYLHYMQKRKLFSVFSNVAFSCNILPERQVTYTTCTCHCFNSIIYTYVCIYVCMYLCTYVYVCIYICIHTHIYTYICVCMYVCVCVCVGGGGGYLLPPEKVITIYTSTCFITSVN